jgi:hypothetical protein
MSKQTVTNPQDEPEDGEAAEQQATFDKVIKDAFPTPGPTGADGGNTAVYNPFDTERLRLDQGHFQRPVAKKLLTRIPVRKPMPKDFIRVHPSPEYRLQLAVLTVSDEARDDVYAVMPALLGQLSETEYRTVTLHLYINRQKVLAFWPVPLPSPDGRINSWHETAAVAAEKAMEAWVRVMSNQSLRGYEVYRAEGPIEDPVWPTETMSALLAIAFKNGRLIDSFDHPALRTLRGEI